jgi:transcriptional regulator with XRE-family HTH domain
MPIGKNVRKYRDLKKWTLRELSKKSGVAISTISDIENERWMPTIKILTKLSVALGVSIDYFFKED